jgi:PEP-CTERM motif
MKRLLSSAACAIGGAALLAVSPAQATVTPLLSLVDPPGQTGTPYDFEVTATATTTTISFGGYQEFAYEYVSDISVTHASGANLLGGAWTLTRAASGSDANTQNDGTSVPALWFGGYSPRNYDTFSQTFATDPGDTYLLKFDFTNDSFSALNALFSASSGFRVTTTGFRAVAVPEPATWALMLLGCTALGAAACLRRRKAQSLSCP